MAVYSILLQALLAAHKKKSASLMQKMMVREGLTQTQMDAMDTTEVLFRFILSELIC